MPNEISVYCAHKKLVKLSQLKPHPGNPNKHPPDQIALLAKVIAAQGWRNPIVVSNRSGLITKGHARREAAIALKCATVPVDYQDYATESEELADMIADNRIAELAEADRSMLRELAEQLDDGVFDMDLTGFDHDALEELMTAAPPDSDIDAEPQIDKAEELRKKWGVERGQIWELGDHKIMCGDCRSEVSSIMNGDKAGMVFTDPPYGVDIQECDLQQAEVRGRRKDKKGVENDNLKGDALREFLDDAFRATIDVTTPGSCWYVCGPSGVDYRHPLNALEAIGVARHGIAWIKDRFVMGRCDYHYRHENIIYGWTPGAAHHAVPTRDQDSVWEFQRPAISPEHPTIKPTGIPARAIRNSTTTKDIVYDPFVGSGTTIIACEQLGRKCRAMEIDPGYVAVSIQRWADATGKTPRLLNGK